jgi:hypothetical protein
MCFGIEWVSKCVFSVSNIWHNERDHLINDLSRIHLGACADWVARRVVVGINAVLRVAYVPTVRHARAHPLIEQEVRQLNVYSDPWLLSQTCGYMIAYFVIAYAIDSILQRHVTYWVNRTSMWHTLLSALNYRMPYPSKPSVHI